MARTCAELQGVCGAHPYGGLTHAVTGTELCPRVEGDSGPDHHRTGHRAENAVSPREEEPPDREGAGPPQGPPLGTLAHPTTDRNKAYWKVGSYPYPN